MSSNHRERLSLGIAVPLTLAVLTGLPAQDQTAQDQQKNPTIPKDTEVQKQGGFTYSILEPGTGKSSPAPGDLAIIHFNEWLSDGTLIHSTRKSGQPFEMNLGDKRFPYALTVGPALLTKGGRIKLTMPPNRAYGRAGIQGRIPPESTMIYEIELLDYVYRPKPAKFVRGDPTKTKATKSGVKYQELVSGKGTSPGPGDIVEIEYTIFDLQGKVQFGSFSTGRTDVAPIPMLSHPFLREVLPMMRSGAVWRCVVPASGTMAQVTADTIWSLKLVRHNRPPELPKYDAKAMTSTRSGLQYLRSGEGKGDRPAVRSIVTLSWSFWKKDGTFVAGEDVGGPMQLVLGQVPHKFLDEVLPLMRVGETMLVDVPQPMTSPQLIRFDTVWQLRLRSVKAPLPIPEFVKPQADELTTTQSGLQYQVLKRGPGKGATPTPGLVVTVHYCGWFDDGKRFDSSYEKNTPAQFAIGAQPGQPGVIPGLDEGLRLMKAGDTFLFRIPPKLAYGEKGTPDGTIKPNTTLVFRVELLGFGR